MSKIRKVLSIAGIKMAIESAIDFKLSDRCHLFEVEEECVDAVFKIQKSDKCEAVLWEKIWSEEKYAIFRKDSQKVKVKYNDLEQQEIRWYLEEQEGNPYVYEINVMDEAILDAVNPLFFVELSEFLINYNAMILHSSFIRYKKAGIVFTAPSGTGKSTQANLWEKYYDAEILNGDRTIIKKEEEYYAYGSPYAGSSHIYENKCVNLKAIVVLRQAKKNKIRKMKMKEAYLCLISEMAISPVNSKVVEKQSKWLLQLIEKIPVYMLECLPDKGAVDLLYSELKEKIDE